MDISAWPGVLGCLAWLLVTVAAVAVYVVYFYGVMFGFAHSTLLGIVSLIPVVGLAEGLAQLLGLI